MVEGDCGYEVVADVRANNVMEEMGVDKPKIAIDGGSRSASEGPGFVVVVGHGCIGVLEEGNCD